MPPQTRELRDAVKMVLVPFIYSRGFQDDKRGIYTQDPLGHQVLRFMRWHADRLELMDIQFDMHGRARFVFNLGVVPPSGVNDYLGHHSQLETDICNIPIHARLYSGGRHLMRWFGLPLIRVPILRDPSSADIVGRAIRLFPQADAWLRGGVIGPNIRVQSGIVSVDRGTCKSA